MAQILNIDSLYERDFFAWTQDQAARLRARASFDNRGDVDWENAAEEIESLGKSERREIASRLTVVLLHLLKWRYQPVHRSGSWQASIMEQRRMLLRHFNESPSLRSFPAEILEREYEIARLKASGETGLALASFPVACPFSVEDVLDPNFYPEASS